MRQAVSSPVLAVIAGRAVETGQRTGLASGGYAEAGRALAAELAAELDTEVLGPCTGLAEAMALARGIGPNRLADLSLGSRVPASRLAACEILEYVPSDPSRLVVRVREFGWGASWLSAEEAMRLFRVPPPAAEARGASHRNDSGGPGAPEMLRDALVELDAGSQSTLLEFARSRGLGSSQADLLEAEILLRNRERFFRFAARAIASALGTGGEARLGRPGTARD